MGLNVPGEQNVRSDGSNLRSDTSEVLDRRLVRLPPMTEPAVEVEELVARALAEDLGEGDVTSEATVPEDATARARIVQKAPGVVYGLAVVAETMRQCGVENVDNLVVEGQWREEVPAEVLLASGSARSLLAAERTALNFLGRLSGVATLTARYAEAVVGTGATILDTRKTTPGLRQLEKAAVAAGGGINHRLGLYDAILVKENHVAAAGGLAKAVHAARTAQPEMAIEVEVRNLDEAAYALGTGADRLLLDNMGVDSIRAAVALRDENAGGADGVSLEASGGITLENVREVAETGVEFISIGALTHSAPTLDFSLLLELT
jgi:nicotinate-nucleotide pyrophosphorylase (carboxylating)